MRFGIWQKRKGECTDWSTRRSRRWSCAGGGCQEWRHVLRQAGIEQDAFVTTEAYPDEVTYRLVEALAERQGLPIEQILEEFGVFWVTHMAREHYALMLESGGNNLGDFIEHLPNFHTRISLLLPHLEPPTFWCSDRQPDGLTLHYSSRRPGLTFFVVGLLKGLGVHYGARVEVTVRGHRGQGAPHDTFEVRWGASS
ncbi:MAG: heme NO-binding domain-containing protein [Polyangiaceae bacterium]|nr:heme NO-binding domain-containing protein [Polyangiaceae bacterium]